MKNNLKNIFGEIVYILTNILTIGWRRQFYNWYQNQLMFSKKEQNQLIGKPGLKVKNITIFLIYEKLG